MREWLCGWCITVAGSYNVCSGALCSLEIVAMLIWGMVCAKYKRAVDQKSADENFVKYIICSANLFAHLERPKARSIIRRNSARRNHFRIAAHCPISIFQGYVVWWLVTKLLISMPPKYGHIKWNATHHRNNICRHVKHQKSSYQTSKPNNSSSCGRKAEADYWQNIALSLLLLIYIQQA